MKFLAKCIAPLTWPPLFTIYSVFGSAFTICFSSCDAICIFCVMALLGNSYMAAERVSQEYGWNMYYVQLQVSYGAFYNRYCGNFQVRLMHEAGYEIGNLDATLILQRPKLSPHKEVIKANLSALLGVDASVVNIKAKTHEKVDSLGENRSIAAHTVVLLMKKWGRSWKYCEEHERNIIRKNYSKSLKLCFISLYNTVASEVFVGLTFTSNC